MSWLVMSLVLSIVLTVGLNLGVRAFPNGARRMEERTGDRVARRTIDAPRVRVFFPWKAMLIGSIVLTVLVNLIAALAR
ncbi:MAG: hypothetical protein H0U92_15095 [Actinobacteria bacterium]|nr:hypothetical protein [Actinomycetota bacterium]